MDEKIDKAIENVVAMIRPNSKPEDALKFSQTALNLAQVKALVAKGAMKKVASAP
jgi:hypothetical protein